MQTTKKIAVIGAGFAGMAAAALLARAGHEVTIYEKNDQAGGRARKWEKDGYTFDMGPSWYWMPEVFEDFFKLFGKTTRDFYQLERLSPSYRVYFGKDDFVDVPATTDELSSLFEQLEPGSAVNLQKFLAQAQYKYEVGMGEFVFKPSHSFLEYLDPRLAVQGLRLQLTGNMRKHVSALFKSPKLRALLEFPVLFLGERPQKTPALYSLMNYADLVLGTWYPMGGMHRIVQAMESVCREQGVHFKFSTPVKSIIVEQGRATGLHCGEQTFKADFVIGNADYHHLDRVVLPAGSGNYDEKYWDKRKMAPSSLLFYLGLNCKLDGLKHHTLFFDEDFDKHAHDIYEDASWPEAPLFYVCASSVTDPAAAPPGCENLFFLMPLAPGLTDSEALREQYYDLLLERFRKLTGHDIRGHVKVKRSYAMKDFEADYNAYKGNAYGLANTLMQTAFLKPAMRAKKVSNMLFTGQLTVPGPGVPPALVSGQVAAAEALKMLD
ncbi:phytoene desaturase [Pedobacter yulinensis]|uniref:Phytoene desaturase n=1 Tax=Pedobacter yulinensis TaxID=2126353 RepID=A0A2T3HPQ6_9SPHI|nr:phytoene desaturase family protein [Pedobacter yulinensis]PST84387.1 phytoene desaturase [Pedobacter yulinensis]